MVENNGLKTNVTIEAPTLIANKPYIFWVNSQNAIGMSLLSTSVSIYSASLPGAPGNPTRGVSTNGNFIVVDWTANPEGDSGGT